MKNYALIFAGGTGQRMNSNSLPKQFLVVHGKPIIIHTLLHFENCRAINGIAVVCYAPYIDKLQEMIKSFGLKKVIGVVSGGDSGQQSIFNGLQCISEFAKEDDIVLIHDGVRPLIDGDLIKENIKCVKECGNAITVSKAIETVITMEGDDISAIKDRSKCYYAKAPQSFYFKDIYGCHLKANAENKKDFIDSATLMQYYGYTLHAIVGSEDNIKITTQKDFFMFKGLLDAREVEQIRVKL